MPRADWNADFSESNPQGCVVGLDLGATSLRIARLGPTGWSFVRIPTPQPFAAAEILARNIRETAGETVVDCVGLSRAPGINDNGAIHEWPSRPEWTGVPLLDWIRSTTAKVPVSADDGICAALWEHERRTVVDQTAITVGLSIGTGLGIGIIGPGGFLTSMEGADTLAHQRFGEVTLPCKCGKEGCLQAVLSAEGLEHASRNGMVQVVEGALYEFLKVLRVRYGVSQLVVTGGGVLRFDRTFLVELFAKICNACGIAFDISTYPAMSALGGAFLLALGSMGWQSRFWKNRVADFLAENGAQRAWADSARAATVLRASID
jgi:hypothetical protein